MRRFLLSSSHRGGKLVALIVLALPTAASCGSGDGSRVTSRRAAIRQARTAPPGLRRAQPRRRRLQAGRRAAQLPRKPQPARFVVSFERQLPERRHHSGFDPLVAATAQGALRARLVGDSFVGAPEHQDLNELLEDHVIGDAGLVTADGWLV
jgi:hypothetical protein